MSNLLITQSKSSGYKLRTKENAEQTDLTLAFGRDFGTAGEILTAKYAAGKLIQIDINHLVGAVGQISTIIEHTKARRINIAGNGVYTLAKFYPVPQFVVDQIVYAVMLDVSANVEIDLIRSGGQTGADEAGIKAAQRLGIDAHAHLPKNFLYRTMDGIDRIQTEEECRRRLTYVKQ